MTSTASASTQQLRAEPDAPLHVIDLEVVPYREAWEMQQLLVSGRRDGTLPDTIVMLEHPPVYTLGRRASETNVLLDADQLATAGIDVVPVDRGGDVTYHGPGQLVVYPIVRLAGQRHVVDFVRALEEVALRAVVRLGVRAVRREGLTGVWVGRAKLVAIGVRVGVAGVTSHGLALNVDPDLSHFSGIVPCGLATEGVASLASLGLTTSMADARLAMRASLSEVLGMNLTDASLSTLHLS